MKKLQRAFIVNIRVAMPRRPHQSGDRAAKNGSNKSTAALVGLLGHMRAIIQSALLVVTVFLPAVSVGDDAANSEAIRVEIEYLRETSRLSIGGVDIATGNMLAEFYERRDFTSCLDEIQSRWESCLKLVLASHDDGLDPEDYHAEKIEIAFNAIREGRDTNAPPIGRWRNAVLGQPVAIGLSPVVWPRRPYKSGSALELQFQAGRARPAADPCRMRSTLRRW